MRIRTTTTAVAAALGLLLGACGVLGGDEPDRLAAGDDFSVEAALAELPVPEDATRLVVTVGDLDAASAAAGIERPDGADDVGPWLSRLTVVAAEDGRANPVFVPVADGLAPRGAGRADEIAAEVGWSITDVAAFAEVSALPFRATVVTGDIGSTTFDDAEVEDLGEGVVTAGTGEDGEQDLDGATAARPLGTPLRMAEDGGRLIATTSTATARAWREGEVASLAEEDDLRDVAAALDGADVFAALLTRSQAAAGPGRGTPSDPPGTEHDVPWLAAGVGWAAPDGEPVMTLVWAFADDGAADDADDRLRSAFEEGVSLRTLQPLAELLALGEIEASGRVVVATVRPGAEGRPRTPYDLLTNGDAPFTPPA